MGRLFARATGTGPSCGRVTRSTVRPWSVLKDNVRSREVHDRVHEVGLEVRGLDHFTFALRLPQRTWVVVAAFRSLQKF